MNMLTYIENIISRKGFIYLIFNLLIGAGLFGQVVDKYPFSKITLNDYSQFLHPFDSSLIPDLNEFEDDVNHNLGRITRRYQHNRKPLLKRLFYRFHRIYLKRFDNYQSFGRLILDGKYNCLTSTILYAIALKHLGFDYAIYETAFHTYLVVTPDDGERVLFESTDPSGGLVTSEIQIRQLEQEYRSLEIAPRDLNRLIIAQANYMNYYEKQITLRQLAGLHYYNLCISYLHRGKLQHALEKLK